MPRPPKETFSLAPSQLLAWAEQLGEALGRGVAKGINSGLPGLVGAQPRRGRPPKVALPGLAPVTKVCSVEGCGRPSRSKGLCSAHYQAERRRQQQKNGRTGTKT